MGTFTLISDPVHGRVRKLGWGAVVWVMMARGVPLRVRGRGAPAFATSACCGVPPAITGGSFPTMWTRGQARNGPSMFVFAVEVRVRDCSCWASGGCPRRKGAPRADRDRALRGRRGRHPRAVTQGLEE